MREVLFLFAVARDVQRNLPHVRCVAGVAGPLRFYSL